MINYYGDGCFRLQSGDLSLLVDPNNNRLKADIVLKTLTPVGNYSGETNEINFPGEYEVKGVEIWGWQVPQESGEKFVKSIYLVRWEGIRFAILGHITELPSAELVENIDDADILILPVGGGHFLSPEKAARLSKQLEPALVIPSFSKDPKEFLKEMGQKGEVQEKIVFKKKDLDQEKTKVVPLSAS